MQKQNQAESSECVGVSEAEDSAMGKGSAVRQCI